MRTGRIQLRYTRAGRSVPVSNEVVTYTPGGAAEALREVRSVSQACAKKAVVLKHGTVTNTFSVTPIKDSKLLPGAVAVRVVVTATDGKKHAKSVGIAVYQEKNDTLLRHLRVGSCRHDDRAGDEHRPPRGGGERAEPGRRQQRQRLSAHCVTRAGGARRNRERNVRGPGRQELARHPGTPSCLQIRASCRPDVAATSALWAAVSEIAPELTCSAIAL